MIRALTLLGVLALASPAAGAGPDDALTEVTARLHQLNAELCRTVSRDASPLFDTKEIALRALGRYRRDRTAGERAEFARLIALRLQQWYAGILRRIAELRIGTGTVDGNWATLPARSSSLEPRRERELTYRLHRTPEGWLLYDVETNGRSRLHAFYRDFDRIILNEGYRELIDRVRREVGDRDARTQPACAASLTGDDARPVAGPDRTGADPPAQRRRR